MLARDTAEARPTPCTTTALRISTSTKGGLKKVREVHRAVGAKVRDMGASRGSLQS